MKVGFVLTPGMLTTGTAYPYEMWLAAKDMLSANKSEHQVNLYLIASSEKINNSRLPLKPSILMSVAPLMLSLIHI